MNSLEKCENGVVVEPTAIKIWHGEYENYKNFNDHDIY
jgi:hypothetical protein